MRLLSVCLPRVHPNILGPGLAQFPSLDISGSVMTDQQQGTVFFSILDTRKVRRLSLENCDLRPVNFVILATSVSCVERANLSRVRERDSVRRSQYLHFNISFFSKFSRSWSQNNSWKS